MYTLIQTGLASLIAITQFSQAEIPANFNEANLARVFEAPTSIEEQIIKTANAYDGVDASLALKIASCESNLRQYDTNGQPLRGIKNPDDVGVFQINEQFHKETSIKRGLNINTINGNIEYAIQLMSEPNGIKHWKWSKPCWGKHQTKS